jgi:hypothetical protein
MGVFNSFGNSFIQLKVGECDLKHFKVGDKVEIKDGVYMGHEGVVVIKDGVFLADFPYVISKWGDVIAPKTVIESLSEVKKVIKRAVEKAYKKKKGGKR